MNRCKILSYIMPVWDGEIVREIVLRAKNKTKKVQDGCGKSNLKEIRARRDSTMHPKMSLFLLGLPILNLLN